MSQDLTPEETLVEMHKLSQDGWNAVIEAIRTLPDLEQMRVLAELGEILALFLFTTEQRLAAQRKAAWGLMN